MFGVKLTVWSLKSKRFSETTHNEVYKPLKKEGFVITTKPWFRFYQAKTIRIVITNEILKTCY